MSNRLNDVWIEFENEFESFKERMDKKFTSLEKNLSSIESYAADMLGFQKITAKLIDFIMRTTYFIFGVLIAIIMFRSFEILFIGFFEF
jgi:hypothetical protein